MNAHGEALVLCLLSSVLSAQDEGADRMLCDPADPMTVCPPGTLCACSKDRLEVVFEHTGSSFLHMDPSRRIPEIQVAVVLEAVNVNIQAWSFGIQHEETFLRLESATFEGTDAQKFFLNGFQITAMDDVHTCKPHPESKCIEDEPGGGYVTATILSLTEANVLPPGRSRVSRATYTLPADQSPGVSTAISLSNRLRRKGLPPFRINIVEGGRNSVPTFVRDGRIVIEPDDSFHRGDPDGDGRISILDAVHTLLFLFLTGPAPSCLESADFDDDGRIDGSDPILILRWLLLHGTPPAAPGPPGFECGLDPGHSPVDLGCGDYPSC